MQSDPPPPLDENPVPKERGIPEISRGRRVGIIIPFVCAAVLMGLLLRALGGTAKQSQSRLTDREHEAFTSNGNATPPALPPPPAPFPPATVQAAEQPEPTAYYPHDDQWEADLRRIAIEEAKEQQEREHERRHASLVVLNELPPRWNAADKEPRPATAPSAPAHPANSSPWNDHGAEQGEASMTDADRFSKRIANTSVKTKRAMQFADPSTIVSQGTLIRGVLETAIQSDLSGMVRARTSHNIYSFDSSRILIPTGSGLIGRYQSALIQGQTRVFVIWSRLLLPNSTYIDLASPGTDLLGRTGLGGRVDTHFFKRFGSAVLLSFIDGALQAGVSQASRNDTGNGATVTFARQGGRGLEEAAEIALKGSVNIPPTVHVRHGTPIQVFVEQDLDFSIPKAQR